MQTWRRNGLLILAIWLFFWLALDSMVDDSPTMDEQNHLARGVAFVRTADPRLSLEHPPLTNALSGLPVALLLPELRLPTDHPSWERQPPDVYWYNFAEQFLWHYNDDVTRMIFLGRLPILFLTLGLALVGYRLAGAFGVEAAGGTTAGAWTLADLPSIVPVPGSQSTFIPLTVTIPVDAVIGSRQPLTITALSYTDGSVQPATRVVIAVRDGGERIFLPYISFNGVGSAEIPRLHYLPLLLGGGRMERE